MSCVRVGVLSCCLIILAACTATPEKYKKASGGTAQHSIAKNLSGSLFDSDGPVVSSRAQVVASASIGVPQVYVDQMQGRSVQLVVQSEYFSANGRTCRRYNEIVNGRSKPGVSCKDDTQGWIDIPLSSFIQ